MNSDVALLLRLASVALPAFATPVFWSRCAMIAHDEDRRAGRDDSQLTLRDNWTVTRIAWRQTAGRRAVMGALGSGVLALAAFVAWMGG